MSNEWQKDYWTDLIHGMNFDLDDDRILKEVALFADKCDISEEITRIESHLEQLLKLLANQVALVVKLNFFFRKWVGNSTQYVLNPRRSHVPS